jgi:hypothetical protein
MGLVVVEDSLVVLLLTERALKDRPGCTLEEVKSNEGGYRG